MTGTVTASRSPRWTAEHAGWLLTGGLAAAAWSLLLAWERSPWARLLEHDSGETLTAAAAVGVFVAAWVLMLAAMMLPTTAPLVGLFGRVVAARPDRRRLLAGLLAGYGSVWLAAGLVAYAADEALHLVDDRWSILADRGWLLVASAVGAAGLYQLTALKQSCLTQCRTPAGVIVTSWRGQAPIAEAYSIGASHARTCVGCCWALMLIMFAVGAGNLGWFLALAAVMTVEKTARWGATITRPVGYALVMAAVAIAMVHL